MLLFLITAILISCLAVNFFVDLTARSFLSTMKMHSLAFFVDLKGSWCNKDQVIQNTPTDELILGLCWYSQKTWIFQAFVVEMLCTYSFWECFWLYSYAFDFKLSFTHLESYFPFQKSMKKAKENITWLETSGDETPILF